MSASPASAARFQLIDKPVASPGKCAGCGCVDRPVVDTRVDIDFYGVVYFCVTCLHEIANTVGMVPLAALVEAQESAAHLFEGYLLTNDLKVITNEQYERALSAISILHAAFGDLHVPDVAEADETDGADASTESPAEPAASKGSRKKPRQNDNAPVGEGPHDVSADSGDGLPGIFNIT